MLKTIEMSLSTASISKALEQLDAFEKWVQAKTEALSERLALLGQERAQAGFNGDHLYDGDDRDVTVTAELTEGGWIVRAEGHAVAFIEFGAGVYFNGSEPYPVERPKDVARIGEYGQGKGKQDVWVFKDRSDKKHFTRGNPATMPMFYASEQLKREISAIAQEVFAD